MVEISQRNTAQQNLLQQLLGRRQDNAAASGQGRQPAYTPKGREIHDTVELSDGAKIINLNRGFELSKDFRADKDSASQQDRLKQGSSDIERIGKLFRAVFGGLRSMFGRTG